MRKALPVDDLGRNFVQGLASCIEYLRIDLHAAGIDHRAKAGMFPVGDGKNSGFVVFERHFGQRIERPDGHQRLTHPVAQPLGERNADPQPRIGAGALAHGHGIQFIGRNARFAQKLVDEHADLAGVVAPLVALAQRKQLPVLCNTDRTNVRTGLDT